MAKQENTKFNTGTAAITAAVTAAITAAITTITRLPRRTWRQVQAKGPLSSHSRKVPSSEPERARGRRVASQEGKTCVEAKGRERKERRKVK